MTDYSIIVPTAKTTVKTTDSIPDRVDTQVVGDEYTLNEARNHGVQNAQHDTVIIMDDDIEFPPSLLDDIAALVDTETLVGVADWDYGWIAGRVMAFHHDLWADVGGFDTRLRSHMGDTKFALDALAAGYQLERLPREVVYHRPHDRSISAWDHAWRGLYVAALHPRQAPRLFKGMVIE